MRETEGGRGRIKARREEVCERESDGKRKCRGEPRVRSEAEERDRGKAKLAWIDD